MMCFLKKVNISWAIMRFFRIIYSPPQMVYSKFQFSLHVTNIIRHGKRELLHTSIRCRGERVRFRKAPGFWLQLVSLAGPSNLQSSSKLPQSFKSIQNKSINKSYSLKGLLPTKTCPSFCGRSKSQLFLCKSQQTSLHSNQHNFVFAHSPSSM